MSLKKLKIRLLKDNSVKKGKYTQVGRLIKISKFPELNT